MIRQFCFFAALLALPLQVGTLRLGRGQVKITPRNGMPMGAVSSCASVQGLTMSFSAKSACPVECWNESGSGRL